MDSPTNQLYSTTMHINRNLFDDSSRNDDKDIPTVNAGNPNYHPTTSNSSNINWQTSNPVVDSLSSQEKLRKGQRQVEDIFTKTKRHLKTNWEHTRQSLSQIQRKMAEMVPKQANNLIYWDRPIQSGIAFSLSIAIIITFMFLSALAAISFWFLALLILIGLYKFYNYIMITFVGRVQDDIFEIICPPDVHISEQQARAWANAICSTGTALLKTGRNLFLWQNFTSSILFGLILFLSFYVGLTINALTFVLIGVVLLFTVPKIYRVYQKPIDRASKQVLDQINQLLAKVTSKLPSKAKKT